MASRCRFSDNLYDSNSQQGQIVPTNGDDDEEEEEEEEEADSLTPEELRQQAYVLPKIHIPFHMSAADPFHSYPTSVLPRRLFDVQMPATRQNLLAMVTTRTSDPVAVSFADSIMGFMRESETTFASVTAAALMYWRIARGNDLSRYQAELVSCTRALELLNREMSHPSTALTEANLWAVLAMSYCGGGELMQLRTGILPRRSFLTELQSLHIYARLRPNDAHVAGLLKMTQMLGGLNQIKTHGIPQIMSFCAILEASRHVTRPGLPFVSYVKSSIQNGRIAMHPEEWRQNLNLQNLGTGFSEAWVVSSRTEELKNAVASLCDFTCILDNYIEGRSAFRTASQLTDARNFTQHTLMMLKPEDSSFRDAVSSDDCQYEACRLASIIFSYLTVMPLPPTIGLYEKISSMLHLTLEQHNSTEYLTKLSCLHLRLWILTMGGIISMGLDIRDRFVSWLVDCVRILELRTWEQMRAILSSFLWHPLTNDGDGELLWHDIMKHQQTHDTR